MRRIRIALVGLSIAMLALVGGETIAADRPTTRYVHASWTTQHGLPTSAITAITQDAEGYLWLGSFAGLIRFDGARFVQWTAIGTSPLPESLIHALAASSDGTLWVGFGNLGGVGRIRGDVLQVYTSNDGLPEGSIQSLVEDRDGAIWAAGPGGLARFREGRWERVGPARGLTRLFIDRNGTLHATASAGVFRFDPKTDALELVYESPRTVDITEDADGTLWTTGQGQLLRPLEVTTTNPVVWSELNGYRLLRDGQGHLWIATLGQGLLHICTDTWAGNPSIERITQQQGLTNDRVLSLFEDTEGSIWVGTSVGLNRVTAHLGEDPVTTRPELDGHNVRAVAVATDGSVWAGTDNGVSRVSGDQSQWYREAEGLPSPVVRALHAAADGRLWVATDRGPAVFVRRRFARLPLPDDLQLNQITAITTDREGAVWLFDARGTYRWTGETATRLVLSPGPRERRVSAALTDSTGRVWVGFASGGVWVADEDQITSYSSADGLSGDMVTAVHEGHDGTIWVATLHGLSRYDGDRFTTLTHANGLPGNRLMGVLGDQEGKLWMGTDFGFVRITPDEFDKAVRQPAPFRVAYRAIDAADGLEGIPTNRGYPNAARHHDGRLWFVTSDGLTVIAPAALGHAPRPPPPRIERVFADDRAFSPMSIRLPPRTVRLQVDYTALTLAAASRVRFRYMLEGNDADWIDAGGRRQAFYTNLPPGTYRFRVAASMADGEWIESAIPWDFAIQPAVYQTTWFYIACALAVVGASWSAWRYRLHQVRRQHALVMAERTRLAREIHDTLLQAMAGVALQLHGASVLGQSAPAVKELCERSRDSLERYIREARFAIWRLRSPELTGTNVDTALRKAADQICSGSKVNVQHRMSGTPYPCPPEIQDHLLRIGQEALRNAVRYANATNIGIDLQYDERQIVLRVEDDGCGFDADRSTPTHWGLAGMREHAEIAGGCLRLTSVPGRGTVVEARVPVQA